MRRFGLFLITLSLSLSPLAAAAHGSIYFEFAPDAWASKRLVVSAGATPYQVFQPTNDFTLTAYDLWVDNTGEAGPVTLTLLDSEGTSLATNNITLPVLPAIPGGNKLHINLASDIELRAGQTYSLKIGSSLLGFGLYYADRLTFLGHNQEFTSEYVNGVAKLGQVQQSFTFKFALRKPQVGSSAGNEDDGLVPSAPPTYVQQIAISNARVVSVTATTVTIAWSTDIAADSRAAIRSQLDPLYVIATGYDPTLELEHTLTVGNLYPSANYFADVFSSQGNELVLTTYTIGFKTLQGQPAAPVQPTAPAQQPTQPAAPPASQPSENPTSNSTPSSNTSQPNTSSSGDPEGTTSPTDGETASPAGVSVGAGGGGGQTSISWNPPAEGEPSGGYRIDIFDRAHNLERQIKVPAGTHTKEVAKLVPGIHHAVVYANNDGVFKKVAPMATFLLKSENRTMLWKIILVAVLWIVSLGGYFRWKFKKEKNVLPPEEGYDPNR
jgi:hypothetical protein